MLMASLMNGPLVEHDALGTLGHGGVRDLGPERHACPGTRPAHRAWKLPESNG
jgi:hypothetical protein